MRGYWQYTLYEEARIYDRCVTVAASKRRRVLVARLVCPAVPYDFLLLAEYAIKCRRTLRGA